MAAVDLPPAGEAVLAAVTLVILGSFLLIPFEFFRAWRFERRSTRRPASGSGAVAVHAVRGAGSLLPGPVATADPLVVVVFSDRVLFRKFDPMGHTDLVAGRVGRHSFERRRIGLSAAVVEASTGARLLARSRKIDRLLDALEDAGFAVSR